MPKTKKIQDLLLAELSDVYSAERQIEAALPKLAKQVSDADLRRALENHLEETRGQIRRLDEAFTALDAKPGSDTCEAMQGLVTEANDLLQEGLAPEVLDAALIAAVQKVEHYEIASYGSLKAYADACGLDQIVDLMSETLEEEKAADETLTALATSSLNATAVQASVS